MFRLFSVERLTDRSLGRSAAMRLAPHSSAVSARSKPMELILKLFAQLKEINPGVREQSGLSRDQISEALSDLDIPLPEELIQLFEWRNGIEALNGFTGMLRLEDAIVFYRDCVALAAELEGYENGFSYKKEWFPVMDTNGDYQICLDVKSLGLALVDMECGVAESICSHYQVYLHALEEGFAENVFSWSVENGIIEEEKPKWKEILRKYDLPPVTLR